MPQFTDNGCFYTVHLSAVDVTEWAKSWPCFGPCGPLWFQFDKRNGDLVDMKSTDDNDQSGVLELSHDSQVWGLAETAGKPMTWAAGLATQGS